MKDFLRIGAIVLLFGAVAMLFQSDFVRSHVLDIGALRESLHPDGTAGERMLSYLIFFVVAGLLNVLGIPRLWISAAAGTIYGAVLGSVIAMVTTLAGAFGVYLLGRSLLRSMVRRRFEARLGKWAERFREDAFFWVLYLRLFPVSNASLTSLLCGCLRVDVKVFWAANVVGFLPLTVVFAMFGSGAAKASPLQLGIGAGIFLAAVVGQWWWTSRRGKAVD